MWSEVKGGDLLPGLSSSRGGCWERGLDGVGKGRKHCVRCGFCQRDYEVGVLCGGVFFGMGQDVGTVRCLFKGRVGLCVCCREFPDGREEGLCGHLYLTYVEAKVVVCVARVVGAHVRKREDVRGLDEQGRSPPRVPGFVASSV